MAAFTTMIMQKKKKRPPYQLEIDLHISIDNTWEGSTCDHTIITSSFSNI